MEKKYLLQRIAWGDVSIVDKEFIEAARALSDFSQVFEGWEEGKMHELEESAKDCYINLVGWFLLMLEERAELYKLEEPDDEEEDE